MSAVLARDVEAPGRAIAYLHGRGERPSLWIPEGADEALAEAFAEDAEAVLLVERESAITDGGYLRDVAGPAGLADVLEVSALLYAVANDVTRLRAQVRSLECALQAAGASLRFGGDRIQQAPDWREGDLDLLAGEEAS